MSTDDARRENGLTAASWVPLADIDADLGPELLEVLKRARIAAYVATHDTDDPGRERLYVAGEDRADARTIVASALRTLRPGATAAVRDPVEGRELDTDAEFAAMVAGWQVDTTAAIKAAERELSQEDAEWRARLEPQGEAVWVEDEAEEHYVPPPPPPLPRLAGMTIGALLLLTGSILLLAFGDRLGLEFRFAFLVAVLGILASAGMLVMRLRARPDEDEDGAIL